MPKKRRCTVTAAKRKGYRNKANAKPLRKYHKCAADPATKGGCKKAQRRAARETVGVGGHQMPKLYKDRFSLGKSYDRRKKPVKPKKKSKK